MATIQRSEQGRRPGVMAMTLIELMGVLAIIAIFASIVLPYLFRQTDKAVADVETASLQSFSDAFQRNITRTRRIPGLGGNDWSTNVAAELGIDIAQQKFGESKRHHSAAARPCQACG